VAKGFDQNPQIQQNCLEQFYEVHPCNSPASRHVSLSKVSPLRFVNTDSMAPKG